ncbi:GNAT family N-acetyltransferase [Iodidimonas muriae]|nr:GNAT family N-acetyltransferase [Iodidimonas muriae]
MSGTSLKLHSRITDFDAALWDGMTDGHPFLRHAFLASLEETGCVRAETGWLPRHLGLYDESGATLLGAMPCYIKGHSYGEYVFDHAWADAWQRAGGHYYPKYQVSIPFTPVTAPKLLVAAGQPVENIQAHLLDGLAALTDQQGFSSAHLTFLPQEQAQKAEAQGYLLRTDQQFHWTNNGYDSFEDFLKDLSSRKRKQIRKERREALAGGIRIQMVEGKDITESHWDVFYRFYMDTGSRKWGTPYLDRAFFSAIGQKMPEQIVLFFCHKAGNIIAGALNFLGPERLYGRYWGCLEDHPFLHFETCYYQAIDYAIAHGLQFVEAGAQGPHKLARGYTPVKTWSAHWISDPGFRQAVARYLETERMDVEETVAYLGEHSPFKKA